MLVLLSILWFISFNCFECYSVIRGHNAVKDQMLEKIIKTYVNPIKQLSENFPDQQIEVQVEFEAPVMALRKQSDRRKMYWWNKPRKLLRTGSNTTYSTTTVTTPASNSVITTPTQSILSSLDPIQTSASTSGKREPVYKDDLDKIIEEIEKKITKCPGLHNETTNKIEENDRNGASTENNDKHLKRIIELLKKKGILLKRNVPKPKDDKLKWIQIKIPKNMQK